MGVELKRGRKGMMESKRKCGVLTGESVGFFTAVHAPKCLKELVMDGRM